jgi:hypothetical protein
MSGEFEKYAVYWVPKHADALARFGTSWTGWCAERGEHRPRGEFPDVSAAVPAITRQVWRHGIHAVIKPLFRLQAGRSRFSLEHALEQAIEESVAFRLPGLRLAVIDSSVAALVPQQDCTELGALVTRVGEAMAPLETPPGEAAPANGFAETLVQLPATDAHRFHIPLTDPLPLEVAFRVMKELQPLLEPVMGASRRLHDVALMGDPGGGRPLRVLQRYDLSDAPRRRGATPRHRGPNPLPCHGPHMLAPMLNDPMALADVVV